MATWDSSWLLSVWKRKAGRPTTDEIADPTIYQMLTEAQEAVITQIESIYPNALYQAPTALTTADGGATFTFGTDPNGYAVAPRGHVGIYSSLGSIPDNPWMAGLDYLDEGTQIRLPNNRTFGGTLYGRWVPTPHDIDASHNPALFPPSSRMLIALRSVADWASESNRNPALSAAMEGEYQREFPRHMLAWRTRFRNGGALAVVTDQGIARTVNGGWPR